MSFNIHVAKLKYTWDTHAIQPSMRCGVGVESHILPPLLLCLLEMVYLKNKIFLVVHDHTATSMFYRNLYTAAQSGTFIVEHTINSTSHRVDHKSIVTHIGVIRKTAVVYQLITSGTTCDIPLFTDDSDSVIVHTFCTIHWRLETDHNWWGVTYQWQVCRWWCWAYIMKIKGRNALPCL